MTTAVVIPAYNGLEYLKINLPAVLRLKSDQVIIVDDASTDNTGEFITSTYPEIKLITNPENLRFPKSVNIGFKAAEADVIILLNQDVTPHPDIITKVRKYFDDPKLFAVSFNEGKFGYAKVQFTKGFLQYTSQRSDSAHSSFWASGGSSAVKKIIWDQLGGFDPVFSPGYHEDLDISWRARKRGYKILWLPDARVEHQRETAFNKAFDAKHLQLIKDRNYLVCQWKNLSSGNLCLHFLAVLMRCLKHPGYLIPVAMAKWHLLSIISYRLTSKNLQSDNQIFNDQ